MNRGAYQITAERLKHAVGLPDDFRVSGVEWDYVTNSIHVHGYSKQFPDASEGSIPEYP